MQPALEALVFAPGLITELVGSIWSSILHNFSRVHSGEAAEEGSLVLGPPGLREHRKWAPYGSRMTNKFYVQASLSRLKQYRSLACYAIPHNGFRRYPRRSPEWTKCHQGFRSRNLGFTFLRFFLFSSSGRPGLGDVCVRTAFRFSTLFLGSLPLSPRALRTLGGIAQLSMCQTAITRQGNERTNAPQWYFTRRAWYTQMSYTGALGACGRAGEWQMSLQLLATMQEDGVSPNAYHYSVTSEFVVTGRGARGGLICCSHVCCCWCF